MAIFINCSADGNGMAGFENHDPNSKFIDCKATNNVGPGFLDLSNPIPSLEKFIAQLESVL